MGRASVLIASLMVLVMGHQDAQAAVAYVELRGSGASTTAKLVYRHHPGEHNNVIVELERAGARPSAYLVGPRGHRTEPGPGCHPIEHRPTDPSSDQYAHVRPGLRCPIPDGAGTTGPLIELGDGNDTSIVARSLHAGATVLGGSGNDSLTGGAFLEGGRGSDTLAGRTRQGARLEGGLGADLIHGSPGPDVIDPGPGEDSDPPNYVDGPRVRAGDGADRILARDARYDAIDCGAGRDRADLDGVDLPTGKTCERISRKTPARAIPIQVNGEYVPVTAQIGCPSDIPAGCGLSVISSTVRGRVASRVRTRIPAGITDHIDLLFADHLFDALERKGVVVKVVTHRNRSLPLSRTFHFSLYRGE